MANLICKIFIIFYCSFLCSQPENKFATFDWVQYSSPGNVNSISFSKDNQKIEIGLEETSRNLLISVKDEGPGFAETSPQKIFKRFYSNRPASFGKHSGLGLNIVKNIVQLHKGTVAASNRLNAKGAQVEVLLPKVS